MSSINTLSAWSGDWTARKAAGDAHELYVSEQLRSRSWFASEWGQGVLHPAVRAVLQAADSPFRHEPDIIAVRGNRIVAIDCKGTVSGGPNYTINRRSLYALRRFGAYNDLPTYCVFDDLRVLTPEQVMSAAQVSRLATAGAYLRLPRGSGLPFDDVFGARAVAAQATRRLAA